MQLAFPFLSFPSLFLVVAYNKTAGRILSIKRRVFSQGCDLGCEKIKFNIYRKNRKNTMTLWGKIQKYFKMS